MKSNDNTDSVTCLQPHTPEGTVRLLQFLVGPGQPCLQRRDLALDGARVAALCRRRRGIGRRGIHGTWGRTSSLRRGRAETKWQILATCFGVRRRRRGQEDRLAVHAQRRQLLLVSLRHLFQSTYLHTQINTLIDYYIDKITQINTRKSYAIYRVSSLEVDL